MFQVLNMMGKVRIKFKIEVIDNACLVARAQQEAMVKKLSDFKEKHKTNKTESIAVLLTRAAEEGNEEAISLLAAGALERRV
jgi:hypothetical protein